MKSPEQLFKKTESALYNFRRNPHVKRGTALAIATLIGFVAGDNKNMLLDKPSDGKTTVVPRLDAASKYKIEELRAKVTSLEYDLYPAVGPTDFKQIELQRAAENIRQKQKEYGCNFSQPNGKNYINETEFSIYAESPGDSGGYREIPASYFPGEKSMNVYALPEGFDKEDKYYGYFGDKTYQLPMHEYPTDPETGSKGGLYVDIPDGIDVPAFPECKPDQPAG